MMHRTKRKVVPLLDGLLFLPGILMCMNLREDLARIMKGDVTDDASTVKKYSRDTSIFERSPRVVVFPKDTDDVAAIVRYVHDAKAGGEDISLAARAAGTDMTGGPLTDSVSVVFTKYMNHIGEIADGTAVAEPGVYYRDFERATRAKSGMIVPSYPASRELCAIGGMVANNSGGELTLSYGKTNDYIRELDVVLSDGSTATLAPISTSELWKKESQNDLEGAIYTKIHKLLRENESLIADARPNVTKNSAGYALWNVMDKSRGTFDLTQLIAGSQGTLAVVTNAKLGMVTTKSHRAMVVIFLSDIKLLPEIVHRVLKSKPESFESYDDQTFKLAVRFMPQIISQFGILQMVKLGFSFIPEMWMAATGGVPKLILMAEFAADSKSEALEVARVAAATIADLPVGVKIARSETESAKYWTIRRESFSLLRKNLHGLYAAPFIDDLVVHPDDYPRFLPELNALLSQHRLLYTIAGHIGDANFHIIPLMDMGRPEVRAEILELMPKVYSLVAKYKGSITGEHNDGIIRTPYLELMYGPEVCELFRQVKEIFDPLDILNPGKKIGGTIADIERSMIKHS